MTSGARARLSLPARSIYQDLLGLVYTEGGIANDKERLMQRLGIGREYAADMDAALAEFEVQDGRLTHPRVLLEIDKLAAARSRQSNGGKARWSKRKAKPRPVQPIAVDDDEDPFG